MSLDIQLYSLGFSFIFGLVFCLLIKINYKFLFMSKKVIQIIGDFVFLIDMSLLYFLGIKIINNGILHIYFFIMFILGWVFGYWLLDKFYKK